MKCRSSADPRAVRERPAERHADVCLPARDHRDRQPDARPADGGADIVSARFNPLSTQDDVAAALVTTSGSPSSAINGEDNVTYYRHLNAALDNKPHLTMDDGADLVARSTRTAASCSAV